MPRLDEGLGPDELRGRDELHGYTQDFAARRVCKPRVVDRQVAMPGRKDDVEEVLPLEDLAEPPLVLDLDRVAEVLEALEDAQPVSRLADNVEVLGATRDARVGAD